MKEVIVQMSKKVKYNIYSLNDLLITNDVILSCPIILDEHIKTRYFVTTSGMVYSLDNDGCIHYKKQTSDKSGYKYVKISFVYKEKHHECRLSVHRLVALAFIPKISGKNEVNHKDGNKSNNEVSNLEWVDHSENMRHAYMNNLNHKGENNTQSIYNNTQIHETCKLLSENKQTKTEISKSTGVSIFTIDAILKHKKWKHISSLYNIDEYDVKAINTGSKPKATIEDIKKVCQLIEMGKFTLREISELTKVSLYTVCDVKSHKTWKHVSKNYNF